MKKQLARFSKTAAAVQVLGLGLLLLISCNNIFISPREGQAAGGGETGRVLISFGNGVEGARTLLPSAVSFQLYKLTIAPVAPTTGATKYENLSPAMPYTIELAVGTWAIHVDAYTDSGGSNKAAEGDSETVTVESDSTTPVSITLRPVSSAGDGTLSLNIDAGNGADINYGRLSIFNGSNFYDPVTFFDGSYNTTDAYISSSGLDLDISLPPGQYRVAASISNNKGQQTYINEVAYIYSNLSTELARTIKADDFMDVATISGTVQYTENNLGQSWYSLAVYTNPEGTGFSLGSTYINGPGLQSYTFHVPRPDKGVTLYFHIDRNNIRSPAGELSLVAGQETATKDIVVNRDIKTLSGSVLLTLGGSALTVNSIYAYPEGGGGSYSATVNSSSWTMTIPAEFSGTLTFYANGQHGGQWYHVSDIGSWTSGSSTSGINLSATLIVVSGSFTATENGAPINSGDVYIDAYREESPGSGWFSVGLEGQSYYDWDGNTCNWTFATKALSPAADVQIRIASIGGNYLNTATETISLGTANVTIPSKTYSFAYTILSGSVSLALSGSALTVNSISAYPEGGGGSYSATVEPNGTWTMKIPSGFSGTLIFSAGVEPGGQWYHVSDIGSWASSQSTSGISLSAALVSVSGSFTATENDIPINSGYVNIGAYREGTPGSNQFYVPLEGQSYYDWTGDTCNWTFITKARSSAANVEIRIANIGGNYLNTATETISLHASDVTIPPTTYAFGSNTLRGSVLLALSGSALTVNSISAYPEGGGDSYSATVEPNGTWTMKIPSDFSGTLIFSAGGQHGGQWYQVSNIGSWASSQSTSGISLSAALVSVSGSFTATENGAPINSGYVYISAYREETLDWGPVPVEGFSNSNWTGNTCNWTFATKALSPEADVEIRIASIGGNDLNTATETISLGTANVTIPPRTYSFAYTILSGSVSVALGGNALTVNSISAHPEGGGGSYSATVEPNGTWTMKIPLGFSGTLIFFATVQHGGQGHQVLIDIDIGSWASSQSTSGINLSAALVVVSGSFTATENGIPINSGDVDIYAWEEILDWEETLGWIGAALLQGFSNFNWTGNTCNWTFATEALSSATAVGIQITVGENYLTAKETISLHASDVVIPPKTYAFSSITGTIGSVTVNGQAPDSVSVYARAENGAYHAGSVSGTSWQIKGIDFSGTFAIGVRVEVEPGVYLHHDLATWTSGTSTSIAPLGDVSITSTSIGGTVTTNGTTALDQGALGVFSQSGTTLEDFYSQTLLGSAEITGGSFSGYVTNSSASGYVVIMVFGAQDPTYYVTSSAVPLNTSMNLNIAAMLQLGDD